MQSGQLRLMPGSRPDQPRRTGSIPGWKGMTSGGGMALEIQNRAGFIGIAFGRERRRDAAHAHFFCLIIFTAHSAGTATAAAIMIQSRSAVTVRNFTTR